MKVLIPFEDPALMPCVVDFVAGQVFPPDTNFRLFTVICFQPDEIALSTSSEVHVFLEKQTKLAEDMLATVKAALAVHCPSAAIEISVVQGLPVEAILDEATRWQPDLLVMGSHNRKGLAHFFLGSVAKPVATRCSCSVALVRRKESLVAKDQSFTDRIDTRPIAL